MIGMRGGRCEPFAHDMGINDNPAADLVGGIGHVVYMVYNEQRISAVRFRYGRFGLKSPTRDRLQDHGDANAVLFPNADAAVPLLPGGLGQFFQPLSTLGIRTFPSIMNIVATLLASLLPSEEAPNSMLPL